MTQVVAGSTVLRICITGPESTGKTTLALELARWLDTACAPEASRAYAGQKGPPLDVTDVGPIALAQIAAEDDAIARARARGARVVVLDTDLLSTVVYAQYYYGSAAPSWVADAQRQRRAALYLLCDVDVPWVPDGIRDQPSERRAMHFRFLTAVAQNATAVAWIRGPWDERTASAKAAVAQWLVARNLADAVPRT